MERVGLYGGSFNPVHFGHLWVARAAQEELGLGSVVFVPAARSPFKPQGSMAGGASRLRWLRLALAGCRGWEIDTFELDRGGISYTIDTVRHYRSTRPGASLFYLIGADHLAQLPKWREAEALADLVEFVVVPRPGQERCACPPPFRCHWLRGIPIGVSSSEIRRRLEVGLPLDWLAPEAVTEALEREWRFETSDPSGA